MKLLPDAIKVFLFNRLLEAGGIVLIALSIFILISISSYSSYDPNIYNLSNYEVTNFFHFLSKLLLPNNFFFEEAL